MEFFFSTSCLPRTYGISKILKIYSDINIKNVELGVCLESNLDAQKLINDYDFNYLVHQLFPPPKDLFIVNLASENITILEKSMNQMLKSLDFCARNNIKLFSFHAGFRSDPNERFEFNFNKISSYEKTNEIFKHSILKLTKYAKERSIKIAIENNVLARHNLKNGKNEILLYCEVGEFKQLLKEINSNSLGILIDLGHLKVTANSLGFNKDEFVEKLIKDTFIVHLHENNGIKDEHNGVKEEDWSVKTIRKHFLEMNIPIVLESRFADENELKKYIDFF